MALHPKKLWEMCSKALVKKTGKPMRLFGSLIAVVVLTAACSSGSSSASKQTTTVKTSTTTTVAAATIPPTTSPPTTVPPPPTTVADVITFDGRVVWQSGDPIGDQSNPTPYGCCNPPPPGGFNWRGSHACTAVDANGNAGSAYYENGRPC